MLKRYHPNLAKRALPPRHWKSVFLGPWGRVAACVAPGKYRNRGPVDNGKYTAFNLILQLSAVWWWKLFHTSGPMNEKCVRDQRFAVRSCSQLLGLDAVYSLYSLNASARVADLPCRCCSAADWGLTELGNSGEPHKLHPRYAVNEVNTTPAAPAEVSGGGLWGDQHVNLLGRQQAAENLM